MLSSDVWSRYCRVTSILFLQFRDQTPVETSSSGYKHNTAPVSGVHCCPDAGSELEDTMGVVVSAVASGLIQNVNTDLVKSKQQEKEKEKEQQNDELVEAKHKEEEQEAESPGRVRTPGYPSVYLPQAPTMVKINKIEQVIDDIEELEEIEEVEEMEKAEEVEEVEKVQEVGCKSPTILDNILSSLRMTIPGSEEPRCDQQLLLPEPEPELEPKPEPELVAEVESFSSVSLPIVSLLPTLTEEISISLAQSPSSGAGWFRRNYTSIDTVQKIYGTHPRLGQRPRSRPRR